MSDLRLVVLLLAAIVGASAAEQAQAGDLRLELGAGWQSVEEAQPGVLAAWRGPEGVGLSVVRRLADELPTTDREAWIAHQRASLRELATGLQIHADESISRGGVTWQRLSYALLIGEDRHQQRALLALVVRQGIHQGWVVSASWPGSDPEPPPAVTAALGSLRFAN